MVLPSITGSHFVFFMILHSFTRYQSMILDSIDIYWILPSSPNGSYLVLRSFPRWSILELKYAFFQSFFFESHQRKKLVKRAS